MDTQNQTDALAKRIDTINTATGQLFAAIMNGLTGGDNDAADPEQVAAAVNPALTLLNCGIIALTEIADAQQRLALNVERNLEAEVKAMADAMAEDKARIIHEEQSSRSFIGQKRANPLTPPE